MTFDRGIGRGIIDYFLVFVGWIQQSTNLIVLLYNIISLDGPYRNINTLLNHISTIFLKFR